MHRWRNLVYSTLFHEQVNGVFFIGIYMRWDKTSAFLAAQECKTRSEFKNKFRGAYAFCKKNNILDLSCKHILPVKRWTHDECILVAKNYNSISELQISNGSVYNYIKRHKLETLAFKHMNCKYFNDLFLAIIFFKN